MKDTIRVKLSEVNFENLWGKVLSLCPAKASHAFAKDYRFYAEILFNDLNINSSLFQIDIDTAELPIDIFLETPLDYIQNEISSYSTKEKMAFLEGVYLAVSQSIKTLNTL